MYLDHGTPWHMSCDSILLYLRKPWWIRVGIAWRCYFWYVEEYVISYLMFFLVSARRLYSYLYCMSHGPTIGGRCRKSPHVLNWGFKFMDCCIYFIEISPLKPQMVSWLFWSHYMSMLSPVYSRIPIIFLSIESLSNTISNLDLLITWAHEISLIYPCLICVVFFLLHINPLKLQHCSLNQEKTPMFPIFLGQPWLDTLHSTVIFWYQ